MTEIELRRVPYHWEDHARCKSLPPALFAAGAEGVAYMAKNVIDTAKRWCFACPVRKECLDDAMEAEAGTTVHWRSTIRGGCTPQERYHLEAARHECAECHAYVEEGVLCKEHMDPRGRLPKEPRVKKPPEPLRGNANKRKTHCPQKHPFSAENTRIDRRGYRVCITCRKASSKMAWERDKKRATQVGAS